MYDFKLYLPTTDNEPVLVFHAWIADRKSYYLRDVPKFGIHKTYEKLFIEMLNGTLVTNSIVIHDDGSAEFIQNSISSICGDEIDEAYLRCCQQFLENSFNVIVEIDQFEMHKMLELKYDAPDLNLQYGISPHVSKKIYSFTNELVDIIQANNTNYGGILQQQAVAGSTVIPYLSERIDINANRIIKKVINDINNEAIDRDFANSNDTFAVLYRKIVKKMTELKHIKDLKIFEISIYNEIGEKETILVDISKIDSIEKQLFGNQVTKQGMVRKPAFQMKSRPNIYSAEIEIDNIVCAVHIDIQNESFEYFKNVLKENEGKEVVVQGFKESERTIVATYISPIYDE